MPQKPLSKERLAAIRKRAEEATSGPWAWDFIGDKCNRYIVGEAVMLEQYFDYSPPVDKEIGGYEDTICNYGDPDFIAWTRSDIPLLLEELCEDA